MWVRDRVDTAETPYVGEHTPVIAYDGAHWHNEDTQILADERKSPELLGAGYLVVRLREEPLPSLGTDHPHYLEIHVHAQAPRPTPGMEEILDWLKTIAV